MQAYIKVTPMLYAAKCSEMEKGARPCIDTRKYEDNRGLYKPRWATPHSVTSCCDNRRQYGVAGAEGLMTRVIINHMESGGWFAPLTVLLACVCVAGAVPVQKHARSEGADGPPCGSASCRVHWRL